MRQHRTSLRLTVIALAVVAWLVGCTSQEPGPGAHELDDGHDHAVVLPDGSGPEAGGSAEDSAREALQRIWSWQPTNDASSGQGMVRARPWLSGELAQIAERGDDPADTRTSAQWRQWKQAGAVVTATVSITAAHQPPDARTVQRQAVVLQQVLAADGTVQPLSVMTFSVDLALEKDQRWRMWRMTLTDSQDISGGPA